MMVEAGADEVPEDVMLDAIFYAHEEIKKIVLLDRINRQGTTVVMATHDDEIVDQMRKRVIELKAGEVVRDQDRGVYGSDR